MRDRHHRALEALEVALQPGHALRVEVVGRLVEQQHVVALEEQPREGDAPPLAARELAHQGLGRRAAQLLHGAIHDAVELPEVGRLDGVLHAGELCHGRVHRLGLERLAQLVRDLVEAREQRTARRDTRVDALLDGLAHELRLLRQVAHRGPRGGGALAVELGVSAGHDLHQRRLARAVEADQTDLRPREEAAGPGQGEGQG